MDLKTMLTTAFQKKPGFWVIADSDPVGISAKVLKDTLSTIEGWFAVDNPFFMVKLSSEDLKGFGVLQMTDAAGEDKIT
jgi:hypothetical protein